MSEATPKGRCDRPFLRQMEAEYWSDQVRKNGRHWWQARRASIARHRGEAGLQILLDEMNRSS